MRNTTGNKLSRSLQLDALSAQKKNHSRDAKLLRAQRLEEHRQGLDHGQGCTTCDLANGR